MIIASDSKTEHYGSFTASLESLDEVREFVRAALQESSLGKQAVGGLLMAIEEVVSNIVRHGYLYGEGKIKLHVRATRRLVTITVTDSGRFVEVDWDDSPDVRQLAETGRRGGLGLLLIRKVTDSVAYRRSGDQNVLTLTKRTGPSEKYALRRSVASRIATLGIAGITIMAVLGGVLSYLDSRNKLSQAFNQRWQETGRFVAAAAAQHILNERSDAELDQLVVGLKSAHSRLAYLILVDAQGNIRAHSEKPETVHQKYVALPVSTDGPTAQGSTDSKGITIYNFTESMTIDRRSIGTVALGVNHAVLSAEFAATGWRHMFAVISIITLGGILVSIISFFVGRPMRRLGRLLRSVRTQGGGTSIPPVSATEDISEVVSVFNDITEAALKIERQTGSRDWAHREMEQAEQLQRALLPTTLPQMPGYNAQAAYRMACHVGGDYYDVIPVDGADGVWAIVVADVAGKGFPAALVMTAVRTAMRLLAPTLRSPVDILHALDRYLAQHHPGGPFVTVMCGVLDTNRHTLSLASAGHTPALHRVANHSIVTRINPKGRPVGVMSGPGTEGLSLSHEDIVLAPGDAVVLYTDGLTEIRNHRGEFFGTEGIEAGLAETGDQAANMVEGILSHLNVFADGSQAEDDLTLMIIQRNAVDAIGAVPRSAILDLLSPGAAASF